MCILATRKSAPKSTKEKPAGIALNKRESNTLVKKVAAVSDSTKTLSKEIKSMTKIFAENQKVLLSMKQMIDTLTNALEQIQKQSKQMNLLEEDSQRLYAGLNQVRAQASLVTKINEHANRLQEQVNKIIQTQKEAPDPTTIIKSVDESKNSIQNNTQMIIKIAQRIDNIKEDLENLSSKADKASAVSSDLDELKNKVLSAFQKTDKSNLEAEIAALKEDLGGLITKTEVMSRLQGEMQKIESEIGALAKRADSTAFVGEGLKSVQSEFSSFKENFFNKTNTIDQKISGLSELLKRSDTSTAEFHKKADKLFVDLQEIKSATNRSSSTASKEVTGLLKLSEFQSNIRILAESKYGELKDIERMAEQTATIINLFDRLSIESQEKLSLPQEVRQWAVSKMLDCADKWEIRFSDLFNVLINKLGRELVKENIRLQQVRDIFGIRGVDEIRKELNLVA
jgi:DNA repair exonuclease SbcCD ATPase subunit